MACEVTEKPCSMCGVTKPLTEFYRDRSKPDGLKTGCKVCNNTKFCEWHRANLLADTAAAQRRRERCRLEAYRYRAVFVESARRRRADPAYHLKERARRAVRQAIKSGHLIRPETCQICRCNPGRGCDGRTLIRADHHKGYERENWLNVQWVCPACDGKLIILRGEMRR